MVIGAFRDLHGEGWESWRSTYRARGEFRRCVFRRLTFYTAFSRATKWRSKSSFREFSSGARIIKRGRIFAQRFTVAGEYECISKNCLRASRSPREFARATPPFCADDVDVATWKIMSRHGSKGEIISHWPSRYKSTKIITKVLQTSFFFLYLILYYFVHVKFIEQNVVFNI